MKTIEILQCICKGIVPVENCLVWRFDTSDLSELSSAFGRDYLWHGHFKKGVYFVYYKPEDEEVFLENWSFYGESLNSDKNEVYAFFLAENY